MDKRMNKRRTGSAYEKKAGAWLESKGYTIVEYNHRNKAGELDIIARDAAGSLVFCEVKYRASGYCGTPEEAVDLRKQRRISMAALWYYMENDISLDRGCRFDVIAVREDGDIRHYQNAFPFRR